MKVLVTGGAGFIGSHVVDALLREGHKVVVLDNVSSGHEKNVRTGVKVYRMSLSDPKLETIFKKEKIEAVCHLAAKTNMRESLTDPFADIESNIVGLVHLLEVCTKKYKIKKFIFSSTGGALYGDPESVPVKENAPTQPISPYGIGKLAGERYLYYYHKVHALPVVILRYSNVYGPRNERKKHVGAVTVFIQNVLAGKPITINGDGTQTRDFVYVEDLAYANVLALKRAKKDYLVVNVSGSKETSVNEMIRTIEKHAGKKAIVKHAPKIRGEIMRSHLSNAKARKELRWQPKFSINEGIKKTVRYLASIKK
ncbi:NAD-dependent epimerase/dehydratase family protein [Candidatus Kaiserbacteria bacterium]|nr:NAD-dependent epimerase/dehydratase family protein [Candidatus Kaiserbacteria bacterium]